ncbi:MAG: SDR family NAD(P)-dependent oxidoreductase, partial [Polyangiaceae bacterium]
MATASERPQKTAGRMTLVVGATGRLGVAISRALVARGDRVALTARDPNKLEAMSAELKSAPYVVADLTKADAVETIAHGVRTK